MASDGASETPVSMPLPSHPLSTKFVPQVAYHRKSTASLVLPFLRSSDGREGALRLVQFSLRLAIYLRRRVLSRTQSTQLYALVSFLSAVRRIVSLVELISATLYFTRSYNPFLYLRGQARSSASVKGKGKASAGIAETHWQLPDLDTGLHLLREVLTLTAILGDNVYLLSRNGLIPLAKKNERKADRISDAATLSSSIFGLLHVAKSRRTVWAEGRQIRTAVLRHEEKLAESEFWGAGADVLGEENEEAVKRAHRIHAEERKIKETLRSQRRRLAVLKRDLTELAYERVRLIAESVFAAYDFMELRTGSEAVKSWSGIVSAAIMLSQSWTDFLREMRPHNL